MKGELTVAGWMRKTSFLLPSSRPTQCIFPLRYSAFTSRPLCFCLHSFLSRLLLFTPTSQFHLLPFLPSSIAYRMVVHWSLFGLISPLYLQNPDSHSLCREKAGEFARHRQISLFEKQICRQTDNPPVQRACQRKSFRDSCQECPEVREKRRRDRQRVLKQLCD